MKLYVNNDNWRCDLLYEVLSKIHISSSCIHTCVGRIVMSYCYSYSYSYQYCSSLRPRTCHVASHKSTHITRIDIKFSLRTGFCFLSAWSQAINVLYVCHTRTSGTLAKSPHKLFAILWPFRYPSLTVLCRRRIYFDDDVCIFSCSYCSRTLTWNWYFFIFLLIRYF